MANYPNPLLDRRRFLRRSFQVAAAGAFVGVAGCSSTSSKSASGPSTTAAPKNVKVQLPWLENVQFAGTYLGLKNGYFSSDGLAVSLTPGGPNITVEPVVEQGGALIGLSEVDSTAAARAQGATLKVFGAKYQQNPYCVASPADKPISSPQELVGKKVGVSIDDMTAYDLLLKLNGLSSSQTTVIPVQFDPSPLANGTIDALVAFITNETVTLQLRGFPIHTFLFADYKYQIYDDVYIATEETIATQPDVLAAYLRAERKGWQDDIADPQQGVNLAVDTYGKSLSLDPKQQLLENQAQIPLLQNSYTKAHGLFSMDPATIAANIATLAVAGTSVKATDLFTTTILDLL